MALLLGSQRRPTTFIQYTVTWYLQLSAIFLAPQSKPCRSESETDCCLEMPPRAPPPPSLLDPFEERRSPLCDTSVAAAPLFADFFSESIDGAKTIVLNGLVQQSRPHQASVRGRLVVSFFSMVMVRIVQHGHMPLLLANQIVKISTTTADTHKN